MHKGINSSAWLRAIFTICALLAGVSLISFSAQAQEFQTTKGVVASSGRSTLVIKTTDGRYHLFIIDRNTAKPATLAQGTEVEVVSAQTDDPAVRRAVTVNTPETAPTGAATGQPDVVPDSVRNTERAIERAARKLKFGFQGGLALDPELVDIGIHAKFGPFFSRNLAFRPSVDFAYGETTRMFGVNAEMIYSLPFTLGARRYVYFGGGPAFNFVEQSFENHEVSFSDFHYDSALNILLGVQFRSGLFTELKTSVYASPAPVLRLIVGYTF